MAKSENQKVKTLFVAKYFLENSDENHPVTAGDITDYLKTNVVLRRNAAPFTAILPPSVMCSAWT